MGYNETPTPKGSKMSPEMEALVRELKSHPGQAYITPDGTRLFTLVGSSQKLMCATALKKNFNDMDEHEINVFVTNLLEV
jgi:hypothetical protein